MPDNNSEALKAASRKRIELKAAVSLVETAAASASAQPGWRARLLAALEELTDALRHHAVEVEAPDGLLAELESIAPRLVGQIRQIKGEHPILCGQAMETIGLVADDAPVATVRDAVLDLLLAIAGHRQRGADLVYEGYEVDLGGG